MTKRFLSFLVILAIIFVLPASTPIEYTIVNETENSVNISATEEEGTTSVKNGVLMARFENMLNHNYLYDDDFLSDKTMIENSILAILDKSVDGEISEGLVKGFIADLYGRQVDTDTVVYDFHPASKGMIAIIPRGYCEYKHEIVSITEGEGGYDVVSEMTVLPHDGDVYVVTVNTVIVPNEGSSFGYNIIESNIA